jgi:N-acetylornithine carbamoyltransferase
MRLKEKEMSRKGLITTTEWSHEELDRFLAFAARVKAGQVAQRLDGKVMGMLFFNPSLRTRTSFEVAMYQLGGHAVNLAIGSDVWSIETADGEVMDGTAAEHVKEAAPVLSRYVDVLGVRAFPRGGTWQEDKIDPIISAFARAAEVPVINMESALWHPCQALADALTFNELGLRAGDPIVLSWAYHPKALPMAVPASLLAVAAQRGLEVRVMRPAPFALDPELVAEAGRIAAAGGGSVTETDDLAALDGARVVYGKSWGSLQAYGKPAAEAGLRAPFKHWQIDGQWMARTDNGRFMHCLPVRRNVVVADEVLDSPASVVVDQAENRLHVQKALLLKLLGDGGGDERQG